MNKFIGPMHLFCHDYTNRQDFTASDGMVIVPVCILHMDIYDLIGRNENYKPATEKQFDQIPGSYFTVNRIVTNGSQLLIIGPR